MYMVFDVMLVNPCGMYKVLINCIRYIRLIHAT